MKTKFLRALGLGLIFVNVLAVTGCDKDKEDKCTVSVTIVGEGTVKGEGKYEFDTNAKLIATPKEGYCFFKWSGYGGKSLDAMDDVATLRNIRKDYNLTAYFRQCASDNKTKAFGKNVIIEEKDTRKELKSAVINGGKEYLVQGDWYMYDSRGELYEYPAGNYSFLDLPLNSGGEFEFIELDVKDFLLVRYQDNNDFITRIGNFDEVTSGSDKVFPVLKNSNRSSGNFYRYSIWSNLYGSNNNPNEEIVVYAKYNTDYGEEYRFVHSFSTYSAFSVNAVETKLYYAFDNKLIEIIVKHL